MPNQTQEYESLLREALASGTGIAAICRDSKAAESVRQGLFLVRKRLREAGDTSLDNLNVSPCPSSRNILFIYQDQDEDEDHA